jgi:hypothetical protein
MIVRQDQESCLMFLKSWRMLTIMLVALSLGPALGHLLELPAKMLYDGPLWLKISQTLYATFGTVGAAFEVSAVVATVFLAFLVRQRMPAFGWTMLGAFSVVASHIAFWIWLAPVNAKIAMATPETLPLDWVGLRYQWECTHAARAILQLIALASLAFSVVIESSANAITSTLQRTGLSSVSTHPR